MARNPDLDPSFTEADLWRHEAEALREVLLGCGLTEERKWRKPCYTNEGRNICIIQRMKGFLALLFFEDARLDDPDGALEPQGPNSRTGFRLRFTSVEDVTRMTVSINALVRQAIALEKAEKKPAKQDDLDYPEELIARLDEDPELATAFAALTPGRQRGYVLHVSGAKQAKTRAARIEKHRQRILDGKGIHDR